jgi:hypothetical protein
VTRAVSSELVSAHGACERCSAKWTAANAQGLASQHHDKSGHVVSVTITRKFTYGRHAGKRSKAAEARLL